MATHSSILAWEISWTEKPGGLQSIQSDMTQRLNKNNQIYICVHPLICNLPLGFCCILPSHGSQLTSYPLEYGYSSRSNEGRESVLLVGSVIPFKELLQRHPRQALRGWGDQRGRVASIDKEDLTEFRDSSIQQTTLQIFLQYQTKMTPDVKSRLTGKDPEIGKN